MLPIVANDWSSASANASSSTTTRSRGWHCGHRREQGQRNGGRDRPVAGLVRVNVIARQISAQGPGRIAGIFHGGFDVNHRIEAWFGGASALVVVANPFVHGLSGLLVVADVLDGVANGEDGNPENLFARLVSFRDGLLVGGLEQGRVHVLVGD